MKNYLLLAFAAVALLFAGCKKDDPGTDEPKVVAVTGVSLNTNAVALEVDDSVTLTATVAPANATNKSVEWSVADDAIATVENGVVKAVAIGETTVTVTTVDGGFTASATITVAEGIIKVTGVTLDKPSLELEIGDSDTLTATVAPDDATNKAVSWSSANDAIATVEDGVVTAVAAGETTVTVTTADGAFKATANVVVKAAPINVTGVLLDKIMVGLEIGESVTVEATVTPETAVNKAVEWSIADTSIATVIDGVVTGVAAGKTELTVTTVDGGYTSKIPVDIVTERVAVSKLEMAAPSPASPKVGDVVTVFIRISPANATNKNVEFVCNEPQSIENLNTDITSIDAGFIGYTMTVVESGDLTFTATTEDGEFKAERTITIESDKEITSLEILPSTAEMEIGEELQLTGVTTPTSDKPLVWSSSNTSIAEVNVSTGMVTAKAPGEVNITATLHNSDIKGTATIVVKPRLVNAITVVSNNSKIEVGETTQLTVNVTPADASNKEVEWISSDTSVATVDANGLVTGVALGEATITAKAKDASGIEGKAAIAVLGEKPTSITFDGKTSNFEFRTWYGKDIDFKTDLKMEVVPTDADLRWIDWKLTFSQHNNYPNALEYNITKENVVASIGIMNDIIDSSSLAIDAKLGNSVIASGYLFLETTPHLFTSYGLSEKTTNSFINIIVNGKYNWDSARHTDGINFIVYCYPAYTNASYDKNKILSSEYTLTSSDESKIRLTKLTTGEGYRIERLDWDNLTSVTLTYTCGRHTQAYTINLIP